MKSAITLLKNSIAASKAEAVKFTQEIDEIKANLRHKEGVLEQMIKNVSELEAALQVLSKKSKT